MDLQKATLQIKILSIYAIMLVLTASMAFILLHERKRMQEIEAETNEIRQIRRAISMAHQHITELATQGESVIVWEKADYREYRKNRLSTDSLLQTMKNNCKAFIHPKQIDTLRVLLEAKETHLLHIMQAVQRQEEADSPLANRMPVVTKQAVHTRTVTRKKKGIAGWFGGKKTVEVAVPSKELQALNDTLITIQQERSERIDAYADSLRQQNKELNKKLYTFITYLDGQAQNAFKSREEKIAETQEFSYRLLAVTMSVVVLLLLLSYFTIQREIKSKNIVKKKREELIGRLQETVSQNEELIATRRNIIQTVTHELRTPLTAICGNAELVAKDEEAEKRIHHAEAIHQSAERMTLMINDLLEYFRLDSGKETVNKKPFRLDNIAGILETEFIPQAEAKQLRLSVHSHADEVVNGDKNLILRIGSNLLSNAIKFTKSGKIALYTDYANNMFTLEVEDTGTGIDKEKLEYIFKPFERLGNAVTQDGFGLGLSIVKSLVELMNGKISVESKPGKGSRFTVTLPLEKAGNTEPEKEINGYYPDISGCSVIVIDNDEVTLGMIRDMYMQSGVDCDICRTAIELTDKMRSKDYDLLITDLKMPDMNGYDILELLRTSDIGNSRAIPIIAVTASGNITEKELKSAGFSAMLSKPFSIEDLLAVSGKNIITRQSKHLDLSPLLAFGNKRNTLKRLITETEKEMQEIRLAMLVGDMETLNNWIHHLRSSWMLMKADQPLQVLYEVIHDKGHSSEKLSEAVGTVLTQGKTIIRMAKKEMEDLWDE